MLHCEVNISWRIGSYDNQITMILFRLKLLCILKSSQSIVVIYGGLFYRMLTGIFQIINLSYLNTVQLVKSAKKKDIKQGREEKKGPRIHQRSRSHNSVPKAQTLQSQLLSMRQDVSGDNHNYAVVEYALSRTKDFHGSKQSLTQQESFLKVYINCARNCYFWNARIIL